MTQRLIWALCVMASALVTAVGIESYLEGASAVVSYPVVVAGMLLLPFASAMIDRLAPAAPRL